MRYTLLTLLILGSLKTLTQKQAIDISVFGKWASVTGAAINYDGKYALYIIKNQPIGSQTLVIRSTINSWEKHIVSGSDSHFLSDGKRAIYRVGEDTLVIISLGKSGERKIAHVRSFELSDGYQPQWLAYQLTTPGKILTLVNLFSNSQRQFQEVDDYFLSNGAKVLLLKKNIGYGEYKLEWLNLVNGEDKIIWEGKNVVNLSFDAKADQIAFIEADTVKKTNALRYYKNGTGQAINLINGGRNTIDTGLTVDLGKVDFSRDGSKIFFRFIDKNLLKVPDNAEKVDILGYKDIGWQSLSSYASSGFRNYWATYNLSDHKPVNLQLINKESVSFLSNDQYVIVRKNIDGLAQEKPQGMHSYFLTSTSNGERQKIVSTSSFLAFESSPDEKWLNYFDVDKRSWFSYEIGNRTLRNITDVLPVAFANEYLNTGSIEPVGIAGFLNDGTGILIYDNYDIWMVDPFGKKYPVNITHGYGLKNHIKFRLTGGEINKSLNANSVLLLTALNVENHKNGFYKQRINSGTEPQLLANGPYIYGFGEAQIPFFIDISPTMNPEKARKQIFISWNAKRQHRHRIIFLQKISRLLNH